MEIAAIIMAFAVLLGLFRCSDKTHLELNVARFEPFEMNGREYHCGSTGKQLKIDALNEEIRKIKEINR